MSRLFKTLQFVAVLIMAMVFLVACNPGANPCEDSCSRHPAAGDCHCHGHCGTRGCDCHGSH